jgi:hypothetical protein
MILDTQLQALPGQYRTAAQIPIGGVAPVSYSMNIVPGKRQSLLLTTGGSTGKPTDYPAAMWSPLTPRPILTNSGILSLEIEYLAGGNLAGCNVIETDTLIVQGGYKYNGSGQFNLASGFQIVNEAGLWVTVPNANPLLLANTRRTVKWTYLINTNAKTLSVVTIECDGETYDVPTGLQNVPAQSSTWLTGVYSQVQLGSMPNGLPWALAVREMQLAWN